MKLSVRHILAVAVIGVLPFNDSAWGQENAVYISLDEVLSFQETDPIWNEESTGWSETISALIETSGAVTATGIAAQSLVDNSIFETGSHAAEIVGSFNGNTGILAVNQSSGSVNNQGNVTTVSVVAPNSSSLRVVQVSAIQELRGNTLETSGARTARIDNSFNDTMGIAGVNQAAGSLNQQLNMLALTLGGSAGVLGPIVTDAALAQIGTEQDNVLNEDVASPKEQSVNNSFNNFAGIAQGSVVAGNMNRVANLLSVSVQTIGAP